MAVNASRCSYDRDLATKNKKYIASTSYFIQGSIRLVDVSTGKVMLTEPVSVSVTETADSYKGYPDYPPIAEVERKALDDAVERVSAVLTTTRPKSELLFFDDKACGLKDGHRLVMGGDTAGALHFVQESLESCKVTSAKKTKLLARAHHNVGVLQLMLGDHESAKKNLQAAVQLHDGPYIKQALDFSMKAGASGAKAEQVEARTREMNEQLLRVAQSAPAAQTAPAPPAATSEPPMAARDLRLFDRPACRAPQEAGGAAEGGPDHASGLRREEGGDPERALASEGVTWTVTCIGVGCSHDGWREGTERLLSSPLYIPGRASPHAGRTRSSGRRQASPRECAAPGHPVPGFRPPSMEGLHAAGGAGMPGRMVRECRRPTGSRPAPRSGGTQAGRARRVLDFGRSGQPDSIRAGSPQNS